MAARGKSDIRMRQAAWQYNAALLQLEANILRLSLYLKAGFNPAQPRVPADGGQWTDDSSRAGGGAGRNRSREDLILVGGRGRRFGSGEVRVGTRWLPATPAQQTRLAISQLEMESALRALARVDPNWRPTPQLFESVGAKLLAILQLLFKLDSALNEIALGRIGPGPFAREWIPAPVNRRLTVVNKRRSTESGRDAGATPAAVQTLSPDPEALSGIIRIRIPWEDRREFFRTAAIAATGKEA